MNKEIILTITMLVSDREETIEKCLESLSVLRKTIPSELIIVDTAGNEKCMSIVRKYADKIVRFPWKQDFAAARNAGLKKAKGKWVMFLDDDEWFENTKELEDFFSTGLYRQYRSASYIVRNYLNSEGTQWQDSIALRLVCREKNTCFVGKIHESLSPIAHPIYYAKDYAHHYGYVYKNAQERSEHSWRNIKPLLERRRECPDDYHAAAQLVQEYMGTRDYFAALELIRELRKKSQAWTKNKLAFTNYVLVREIEIYRIQQRFQEAYTIGKEFLNNEKILLFVRGSILNQLIGVCYNLEKYSEALEYMEQFQHVMSQWEENEGYEKQDLFRISASYLLKEELSRFSFMALHIYVMEEEWEKAGKLLMDIDWKDMGLRMFVTTAEDILKILSEVCYQQSYLIAVKTIMQNPIQRTKVFQWIKEAEGKGKWNLLFYVYQLPLTDVDICKYHILYADHIDDREEIKSTLQVMKQEGFPLLQEDNFYWEILCRHQISLVPYEDSVRAYEWIQTVKRLLDNFTLEESETVYLTLVRELEKKDIRFLYLTAFWMQKRALEMKNWESRDCWDDLYQLALHWISCGSLLYREEVFTGAYIEAIPVEFQFAWYILQANALREVSKSSFIHKVADAAKVYPAMKELCKKVITDMSGNGSKKKEEI